MAKTTFPFKHPDRRCVPFGQEQLLYRGRFFYTITMEDEELEAFQQLTEGEQIQVLRDAAIKADGRNVWDVNDAQRT